ncbi:DoxX family membrane protein [Streptomyces sp. AC495_CC817]|uniref:DoxX family membrane protein n=1 Tax=Streptomyces sp. AC495_CC817 TaxID=2823900 RepID=UPI001C2536DC|nr:DoxX family membrane protein [Streptomyces sp. AC495_CC817]
MSTATRRPLAAPVVGAAARVAVGVLWLLEALEKIRAGFGGADILLVAQSTESGSRTPWWFAPLGAFMRTAPGLFGVGIPVLELLLGILLVIGLTSRIAALMSIGTLMLYWGSDQLISQHPVMVMLSAVVLAIRGSGWIGVDGWLRRRRSHGREG